MRALFIAALFSFIAACGDDSSSKDQPQTSEGHENHDAKGGTHEGSELEASSEKGDLMVKVQFDPTPLKAGSFYTFHIQFLTMEGTPFEGDLSLDKVNPFMQTMNHGVNNPDLGAPMAHGEKGHFMVKNVKFSMAGEAQSWVLDLTITRAGETETIRVPLPEVSG